MKHIMTQTIWRNDAHPDLVYRTRLASHLGTGRTEDPDEIDDDEEEDNADDNLHLKQRPVIVKYGT